MEVPFLFALFFCCQSAGSVSSTSAVASETRAWNELSGQEARPYHPVLKASERDFTRLPVPLPASHGALGVGRAEPRPVALGQGVR